MAGIPHCTAPSPAPSLAYQLCASLQGLTSCHSPTPTPRRDGLHNAYFWVVSCLIMYTVALPGYAHERWEGKCCHPLRCISRAGICLDHSCSVCISLTFPCKPQPDFPQTNPHGCSPMPILALWRLACTAIGLAIEFVVALVRACPACQSALRRHARCRAQQL